MVGSRHGGCSGLQAVAHSPLCGLRLAGRAAGGAAAATVPAGCILQPVFGILNIRKRSQPATNSVRGLGTSRVWAANIGCGSGPQFEQW